MFRLYAAVVIATIGLALAGGLGAYEIEKSTTSLAQCGFRVGVPLPPQSNASDSLTYERAAAADAVSNATLGGAQSVAFGQTDKQQVHVSLVATTDDAYRVDVKSKSADVAVKLANSVCEAYVRQIGHDLRDTQQAQESAINTRIRDLQVASARLAAIPPTLTTPSDLVESQVTKLALSNNEALLAATMSAAPYATRTTGQALGAHPVTAPRLPRVMLVAGVTGFLLSFLMILLIETFRDRTAREGSEL